MSATRRIVVLDEPEGAGILYGAWLQGINVHEAREKIAEIVEHVSDIDDAAVAILGIFRVSDVA